MPATGTLASYFVAFKHNRPVSLLPSLEGLGRISSEFGQYTLEGAVFVQESLAPSQLAEQAEGRSAILAESVQRKVLGIKTVASIRSGHKVRLRNMAFLEETQSEMAVRRS